jgi:hypothetical protein
MIQGFMVLIQAFMGLGILKDVTNPASQPLVSTCDYMRSAMREAPRRAWQA